MTNKEMIVNYNGLAYMQELEKRYSDRTGEKLFQGRMRIIYAMKKNMNEFAEKLKPYNEARDELTKEYRDLEAEKRADVELKNKIVKSQEGTERYEEEFQEYGRRAALLPIQMQEGKDRAEYGRKLEELLNIDVRDVAVHKISLDALEGIELDSQEFEFLMFMLEE